MYIAMETVKDLLHSRHNWGSSYEGHQVEPRKWLATARKWMSKPFFRQNVVEIVVSKMSTIFR